MSMSFSKYRLVLVSILVIAGLVSAFVVGGAVGFADGFETGYEIARITDGHLVMHSLRFGALTPRPGDDLLEGLIDDARISYGMKQKRRASIFDVIDAHVLDSTVERDNAAIVKYRRMHPSPMSNSSARKAIKTPERGDGG